MTVTGIPALAKFMAMPPPMVPPPMMAAVSMDLAGVSAGTSRILATSRSAKKTWRWAADCADSRQRSKISRSLARPSSNGSSTAAATASMQASGASKPRTRRATDLRKSSKIPFWPRAAATWSSSSLVRRGGRPSRAKATAASTRSPSAIASTTPIASGSAGGSPETIISSAGLTPIRRGNRWVPPAPGTMPSLTSGSASRVLGAATR